MTLFKLSTAQPKAAHLPYTKKVHPIHQTKMAFYTKKPVTIEARQFDGTLESAQALYEWVESCNPGKLTYLQNPDGTCLMYITTLEGPHSSTIGDFLIRGVKNEFYFCKPDIFEMTYEPA